MIQTVLGALNGGFLQTLKLFAVTLAGALPLGLLLSFCSMSRFKPLRWLTRTLVWIVRGTPLMLQLLVVFFGPYYLFGMSLSNSYRFYAVIIGFSLNYAAYFAEIYRAGIESIPVGQYEAAEVLGYSKAQTFVKIILPQAVKNILPALGNEFVTMIKETSLASTFYIGELMYTRTLLMSTKFYAWQPLIIIAAIYFVVTFVLSKGIQYMEKRMSVSD